MKKRIFGLFKNSCKAERSVREFSTAKRRGEGSMLLKQGIFNWMKRHSILKKFSRAQRREIEITSISKTFLKWRGNAKFSSSITAIIDYKNAVRVQQSMLAWKQFVGFEERKRAEKARR